MCILSFYFKKLIYEFKVRNKFVILNKIIYSLL